MSLSSSCFHCCCYYACHTSPSTLTQVSSLLLTLALPFCFTALNQSKGVLPSTSWSLRSPPASSRPLTTDGLQENTPAWTGVLQSSQRLEDRSLYVNMLSTKSWLGGPGSSPKSKPTSPFIFFLFIYLYTCFLHMLSVTYIMCLCFHVCCCLCIVESRE